MSSFALKKFNYTSEIYEISSDSYSIQSHSRLSCNMQSNSLEHEAPLPTLTQEARPRSTHLIFNASLQLCLKANIIDDWMDLIVKQWGTINTAVELLDGIVKKSCT